MDHDDYYGFAAFFSQVGVKKAEDPRERIVYDKRKGDVKHPVSKAKVEPRFLGGELADVKKRDRREVLAEWLTASDNAYFSRNIVNIIWANYLGRGIVHEPDDMRLSNPPSNPELLDALAAKLVEYDYDFRKIVRDICNSRTYQLSTQTVPTNELDERNFSHAKVRRIRAEILLDCLTQVTGTQNKFAGLPRGSRAVQIADGKTSNYFLTTFGRATRETVCSCEVTMEPNLSQALLLLNGNDTHGKIRGGGVVPALMKDKEGDVLESLFIRCLSRKPTGNERERLNVMLEGATDKREAYEDVFWSLLNSKEFIFTH